MNRDPGLICFKHCKSDIFVFSIPDRCPECGTDLLQCSSITPFRMPFPFMRASQHPCSIVLKPTKGDFLRSYSNNADLHIGVTDSRGRIFSYDESGLKEEKSSDWTECLCIECSHQNNIEAAWDGVLESSLKSKDWISSCYNEEEFNCYTFVLNFLRNLPMCHLQHLACDRKTFCENVLIPLTVPAGKYISLYRRVTSKDYFVKEQD